MVKYIVFDLWGTLIYLEEGWMTFNILKDEFRINPNLWKSQVKPLFLCKNQPNEESFLRDLKEVLGLEFDINKYAKMMREQKDKDVKNFRVYPDVRPTLEEIISLGIGVGVISNQATFYEPCFFNSEIANLVNLFVFSNLFGYRKPNPMIYQEFLRLSRTSPREVIMVGDNIEQDYEVPRRLEIKAILLDRKDRFLDYQIHRIRSLQELVVIAKQATEIT